MKNKQNVIITLLVILILVVVIEGGVYLYYQYKNTPHPPVCAPGDTYNIMTGKPCADTSSLVTTPATDR